jgi:uncharacterized membrane protein
LQREKSYINLLQRNYLAERAEKVMLNTQEQQEQNNTTQLNDNSLKKVKTEKPKKFTTLMLCRAGVIAALYVALTVVFGPFAFGSVTVGGILEIRPSEALTILPLFFVEAIPGLYVGCMLANLASMYTVFDIFLGSLATLIAAALTYGAGRLIKNNLVKVIVGGFFPIIINAFVIPAVMILAGTPDVVYWYSFATMILNEGVWIYVLGIPLFYAILSLQKKGVKVFLTKISQKCE